MHDSSSTETAQTETETADGADKPPHIDSNSIPLPPPETGTYEKQPGHTVGSLKKLVMASAATPVNGKATHLKQTSMASISSNGTGGSSPSSPTGSEPNSDWGSAPSTRPPSQAPSRAPSVNAGSSGGKFLGLLKIKDNSSNPNSPVTASAKLPLPHLNNKSSSTPASPALPATPLSGFPHDSITSASTSVTVRPKAASVHSQDGRESHKFTLKDLLGSGPKLSRKSSQRSTSSRRSDDEDGRARSTAGDSTTSLSKKYGICQKVAIGKGATSVVKLAHKWDRSEEKLYAVKEFRKRRKNESEKEYVKKLTAEFCISSTLHHINIVETVDLVQDENQKWCEVMEFCPGGDLYAAIKKGGMSPSEVECCFKQILNGVLYLHSQGVAHRDLKPENLFFDTQGHLKIGDYGASTVYRLPWEATIHMSTGLCGSEPYIAPEQFLGKPYDARLVDIWAVGIVYYCLHFQELPWRAAQSTDALYQSYASACASSQPAQSSCPPTINNLSPRACRTLIRKMLEPDPKARTNIEDAIKHPWVTGIEVCHEVEEPKHVHVHARALAQAQLREVRD